MNILIELITELFVNLFGSQADKISHDREVPAVVKVLFLIFFIGLFAAVSFICWNFSK